MGFQHSLPQGIPAVLNSGLCRKFSVSSVPSLAGLRGKTTLAEDEKTALSSAENQPTLPSTLDKGRRLITGGGGPLCLPQPW